jgi:prephenate dehydratase
MMTFSTVESASLNPSMGMGAAVTEIDKSDPKTYWEISDRTALSFSLDDTPGTLLKALSVFTNNQINLTRI